MLTAVCLEEGRALVSESGAFVLTIRRWLCVVYASAWMMRDANFNAGEGFFDGGYTASVMWRWEL